MKPQHTARIELNALVKALAAKDRPGAVAILAKFGGALRTPDLKTEDIPACTAAFEEALAQLNGSS